MLIRFISNLFARNDQNRIHLVVKIINSSDERISKKDRILIVNSIITTFVIVFTLLFTAYQTNLSRIGIANAIESRRAWLHLDASTLGDFVIDSNEVSVMALLRVKNVGETPALNVQRYAHMIFASDENIDPCSDASIGDSGPVVFPGEELDLLPVALNLDIADAKKIVSDDEFVSFKVLICVSYQTQHNGPFRQTGSTFFLERSIDNRETTLWSLDPNVFEKNIIHLHRASFSDVAN